MELIGQVTINESLENDTYGNPKNIYNTYIEPLLTSVNNFTLCYIKAENNTASNYRLVNGIFYKESYDSTMGIVLRKASNDTYTVRNFAHATSSWCSSGTTLKVYRIE